MAKTARPMRGSSSNSHRRLKPVVADRLQEAAAAALEKKLSILTSALAGAMQQGIPSVPDGIPTSRRQFLAWCPIAPDGEQLGKNANDTLKKHKSLLSAVDETVDIAKAMKSQAPKAPSSKEHRLATSKRMQRLHWTLRMIAERALVAARKDFASARDEALLAKAKLASAQAEFRSELEKLTGECLALRQENARLTSQLSKTIPLRSLQ